MIEDFIKNLAKSVANSNNTNVANTNPNAKQNPAYDSIAKGAAKKALGAANTVGRIMSTDTTPTGVTPGYLASREETNPANTTRDSKVTAPSGLASVATPIVKGIASLNKPVAKGAPTPGEAQPTSWAGTPSSYQLQTQGIANVPNVVSLGDRVMQSYRKDVSPRLAATLLVMNSDWRKKNQDLIGDASIAESIFTDTQAYKVAIEQAKSKGISPGRALVYGIGAATSGATGQETAVEKIDWENKDTINEFFNHGAARFWSGLADFGFNNLDPAFLGTMGVGKAYKGAFAIKVTAENQAKIVETIYKGAEGEGTAAPFFDLVAKAARENTPSIIERHKLLENNPRASQISQVLVDAYNSGGNNKLADALAVGVGDKNAYDRIVAEADALSKRYQTMAEKEASLTATMKDIVNNIGADGPGYETVDGLEQFVIPGLLPSTEATQREIDLANKIGAWLPGFQSKMDGVHQQLQIAQIISGARIENSVQRVGGIVPRELKDGFISIPTKYGETVAKHFENRRAALAEKRDLSYWRIEKTSNPGESILYWTNPSARLNELPSGIAQFGGPAGNRSVLEASARLKNLARHVDMPPQAARSMYNDFLAETSKIGQYNWFTDLQKTGTYSIISKHVSLSDLTPEQADIVRTTVDEMVNATKRAQTRAITQLLRDERYSTIYDNEKVIVPQFQQLIQDIATSRAVEMGRQEPDANDIRYVVENLLNDTPTMESQVPGVHIGIDFGLVDQWAGENKSTIEYMVSRLKSNPDITKQDIKDAVRLFEEERTMGERFAAETRSETVQEVKDVLAAGYNAYVDFLWKPVTLLSFRYSTRNVAEGLGRVLAMALEYHDTEGYGYADMFSDFVDSKTLENIKRNSIARKNIKAQTKNTFLKTGEFHLDFRAATKNMTQAQADAHRLIVNAQDSVSISISDLSNVKSQLEAYTPNAKTREVYDEVKSAVDYIFYGDIPKNVDMTFVKLILDEKPQEAWLYYMGKPKKVNQKWQQRMSDETLLRSLQHIDDRVNNAVNMIAGSTTGTHAGIDTFISNVMSASSNIVDSIGAAKTAVLNTMEAKGVINNLIVNREKILRSIETGGTGAIEVIPGVFIPDAYANAVGQIMRGQVSASASTSSIVLNARRNAVSDITGRNYGLTDVMPTKFDANSGAYVVNPSWATSHAEYINTKFSNSAIAMRIINGQSDDDIYKWINSQDGIAQKVRSELDWTLENYPKAPGNKNEWWYVIQRTRADLETQVPRVGLDGEDLSGLREKIKNGTFTEEDSLSIPEVLRTPIKGIDLIGGDKSVARIYRNIVSRMFNFLATRPEDAFVRHPFYRMVYRNEARSMARELEKMGYNVQDMGYQIADHAHRVAYKQVMERLYSVERYTSVAGVMKYVSPFYMAQQNSARFWAGAAMRRPQLPVRMLQLWNAPNQVFDVRDDKGNKVEWSFPWEAGGETLRIAIPERLKKYFGYNDYAAFNKTSADLVFQGQVPMMPQFGSPVFDASLSTILYATRGTKLDPDYFVSKTLGMEPNFFLNKVAPFYNAQAGSGPLKKSIQGAVPTSSWMRALLNWSVGATGFSAGKSYSNSFATRYDAAYRDLYAKRSESGVPVTAQEDAELWKQAYSNATNSFLWEAIFAFGMPIVPGKLNRNVDLETQTLRGLRNELGYDEGTIEYTNRQNGLTAGITAAVGSTASDNKFGLYSTPETMRNLKSFSALNDAAQRYFDAAGKSLDSRVIGYFMNEGDPNDFSTLQNEGLYSTKINGKAVKVKVTEEGANKGNISVTAGWNEYFNLVNELDKVKQAGIDAGNGMTNTQYDDAKSAIKKYVEEQYPIWADNNGFNDADKQIRNQKVIYLYLNDKKFKDSKIKTNKTVEIADLYFNTVRPQLVSNLGTDKLTDREDIATTQSQVIAALKQMYTDKASQSFIEQFIAGDKLAYINTQNPLG